MNRVIVTITSEDGTQTFEHFMVTAQYDQEWYIADEIKATLAGDEDFTVTEGTVE